MGGRRAGYIGAGVQGSTALWSEYLKTAGSVSGRVAGCGGAAVEAVDARDATSKPWGLKQCCAAPGVAGPLEGAAGEVPTVDAA